jgi:hypothetical protein
MAIKNQHLLLGVVALACLSAGLTIALFVSLQSNDFHFRELKRRLDELEFRRLPALEEQLQQRRSHAPSPKPGSSQAVFPEAARLPRWVNSAPAPGNQALAGLPLSAATRDRPAPAAGL